MSLVVLVTFMLFIMMSLYFVVIHGNDLVLWLFKGINYDNFHFTHVVCSHSCPSSKANMCFQKYIAACSNTISISYDVHECLFTVTRRVSQVEQELVTLPDDLNSSPVFSGVYVAQALVFLGSVL